MKGNCPQPRVLSKRSITENLIWLLHRRFGDPKEVYTVKDLGKVLDALDGPKGRGPYFFITNFFFAEYEDYTLCFFMGNNE